MGTNGKLYIYVWGPRFRIAGLSVLDRKGQTCRLIARGAMNSALVEFDNGERHVISRSALRKPPDQLTAVNWGKIFEGLGRTELR